MLLGIAIVVNLGADGFSIEKNVFIDLLVTYGIVHKVIGIGEDR